MLSVAPSLGISAPSDLTRTHDAPATAPTFKSIQVEPFLVAPIADLRPTLSVLLTIRTLRKASEYGPSDKAMPTLTDPSRRLHANQRITAGRAVMLRTSGPRMSLLFVPPFALDPSGGRGSPARWARAFSGMPRRAFLHMTASPPTGMPDRVNHTMELGKGARHSAMNQTDDNGKGASVPA